MAALVQRQASWLYAAFVFLLLASAAAADDPVPVRLWVGGDEVFTRSHPIHDGEKTYVPVEVLPAMGLTSEPGPKGDQLRVRGGEPAREETLRLYRRSGVPMLLLSEVIRLADAEVRGPGMPGKDGRPRPVKPGDVVYVLARLRDVRVESGTVRIRTSFPVPLQPGTLEDADPPRDYVDCIGTVTPEGFTPAPVPAGEARVRAVTAEQASPEVARVVVHLAVQPAGSPGPSAEPGTDGMAGALRSRTDDRPLSVDDFLRQVQANYPKIVGADANRRIAQAKREEKAGAFDPVLFGDHEYSRFPDSSKPGKLKDFNVTDFGVEFLTPYGVKIVGFGRLHRGAVKSPLSPTGTAGEYLVGVKLPLLRGRGINEKWAGLRQARLGVPLADADFDTFRLDTLLDAAGSYWNWVAAGRRLTVAEELLKIARIRAAAVKDRADAGDLPLIDVVEANQEVQRRQEGLRKAERDLQKETFKLALYMWNPDGSPAPLPTTRNLPPPANPVGEMAPDLVELGRGLALERRPELRGLAVARDIVRVDLDLAKNQRLPIVDVGVTPGVDTGVGGAGPTLKAGVSVALPLRQRTADGLVEQARLKLQKLDFDLQLERQRILTEVEDAVSAVNLTYQRYLAAVEELQLARRLEQGERDRFDLGDSTLFLVNQRERATAEAANKVITIQAEYEQAQALFRAVTAQL